MIVRLSSPDRGSRLPTRKHDVGRLIFTRNTCETDSASDSKLEFFHKMSYFFAITHYESIVEPSSRGMHTNSDTLLEPLLLQKNTPSRLFHASRCKIKHILAPLTSVGLIVSARRYREPKQSSARRAAGWGTVFLHRTSVPCSRCSSWQSSRSCTWCAQAIANTPGFSFPTHVQSAPERGSYGVVVQRGLVCYFKVSKCRGKRWLFVLVLT